MSTQDDKYRCDFCWTEFDTPVALLEHEAQEDDRLYDIVCFDENGEAHGY